MSEDLIVLRKEFPAYKIWREETPGRVRYVARSRTWGQNPHTLVTPDPAELRAALQSMPATASAARLALSPDKPSIARMYSYWLREKDHFAVDREAANKVLAQFPEVADVAQANRAFMARAVRYLAQQGITQFIDVGSGLPASPNVHETARAVTPGARIAYVDRDPVVLAHARALLAIDEHVSVLAGDIRDASVLLKEPVLTDVIDSTKPAGVLLISVLHFLTAAEADTAVAAFRQWMPPGSYMVISAGTSTGTDPELVRLLQDIYGDIAPVTGRTVAEIEAWFDGLNLVKPGLVDAWTWRPDSLHRPATSRVRFLAGVGRKPSDALAWSA